jgi:hypothetical protein
MAEWAERIPAAIAKAEGLVEAAREEFSLSCDRMDPEWEKVASLGPEAVALAKALWAHSQLECDYEVALVGCAALRAFVEKVEAL